MPCNIRCRTAEGRQNHKVENHVHELARHGYGTFAGNFLSRMAYPCSSTAFKKVAFSNDLEWFCECVGFGTFVDFWLTKAQLAQP